MTVGRRGPISQVPKDTDSAAVAPSMPNSLRGQAARFWRQWVPVLHQKGSISEVDVPQLVNLAETWEMLQDLRASYRKSEPGTREATYTASIVVGVLKQYTALAAKFGMTTADRARLPLEKPKGPTIDRRTR